MLALMKPHTRSTIGHRAMKRLTAVLVELTSLRASRLQWYAGCAVWRLPQDRAAGGGRHRLVIAKLLGSYLEGSHLASLILSGRKPQSKWY
eukprot:1679377-Amphidinium_carterae.1